MEVHAVRTPALGDTTYVLVRGGTAVLVDPQRDFGRFVEIAADAGAAVSHVVETHVHNDYVSGGRAAARATGADLVLPAASGVAFGFVPAFHREDLDAPDGIVIRPLHTPGHTPEHTSFLVLIDGVAAAVFTGGCLLVGAAGRTDLLGAEFAHQLAVLQHGSLQRLGSLPGDVAVYPTHGEGSFCTASGAGRTTSSIAEELAGNPVFGYVDAGAFATDQLAGLVPYPSYYARMAPINRAGPPPLPEVGAPELTPSGFAVAAAGATVIDGRPRAAHAAGHVPGALGIELGDSFAPWVGWLADPDRPVLLVLDEDQDAAGAGVELARIGFDRVDGVMQGMSAWRAEGREVASFPTATAADLGAVLADPGIQVVDCRAPDEWEAGHLDGTMHRYVPDLAAGLGSVDPDRPVWLVCRTGNRAAIAAGLMARHGVTPTVVTVGGVPDLIAR